MRTLPHVPRARELDGGTDTDDGDSGASSLVMQRRPDTPSAESVTAPSLSQSSGKWESAAAAPAGGAAASVSAEQPPAAAASPQSFLESPHTVTYFFLGLSVLIYYVFVREHKDANENIRLGLAACVATFLLYCALHVKSIEEAMHRPHVIFWRLTLGVGVAYLLLLVFGLFQTVDDARVFLSHLYPDLGKKLPDRDYASDCRLFTPENPVSKIANVMATIKDEFVLAHILGYFGKALLWRDWKLMWVISLMFELTEVVFQHMMENFKECWWDHILLDVLGCNLFGMYLGMKTVEFFQMRTYDWVGTKSRLKRIGMHALPEHLDVFDWRLLSSAKRFVLVFSVVWVVNSVELYGFFLKYVLWVPPKNPMNTIRLLIWFGLGVPALREFYQFVTDPKTQRIGVNSWVSLATFFAETLLIFKYSAGTFSGKPMPVNVMYPLIAATLLFFLWFTTYFSRKKRGLENSDPLINRLLQLLVVLIVALLVFIFVSGCPDLEWGKEWFTHVFG